jgi:uncharacterized protein (TIGR02145 family)
MKRIFPILLILSVIAFPARILAQPAANNTCIQANPFCGSAAYTFPSGACTTNCYGESGPCYGCMGVPNNPAWYYMQIGSPGTIVLTITESPYTDIDYCCWGPFSTPTGACTAGLTCSKIASCSFSPWGTEICTINNAQAGEFYILVLSNFVNQSTQITFQQTNWGQPGAGTTNCNLVTFCSVSALTGTASLCSPATNTFSISGNVEFSNPPASGTLTVTDITASPNVSQSFSAPFVSPKSFSLAGIPCDGTVHTLSATFSDSTNCFLTSTVQAPQPQCPAAVISGGGTVCNTGSATSTVQINVTGGNPPYSFTWAIDGTPQTPVTGYTGPFPYSITATSSGTYSLVSVSGSTCSGTVSGSAMVTFLLLPVVSFAALSTVCNTTPAFPLSGGAPAGGTYTGAGVTAGSLNPSAAGTGIHVLTYTYSDANGCTDSAHASILVAPTPAIMNNPLSDTTCSGQTATVSLVSTVPATFTWTATLVSGSVAGFTSGGGPILVQTLFNSGNTTGVVKYTLSMSTVYCTGGDTSFFIVVRPKPVFTTTPADTTICGSSLTHIVLRSTVAATTFSWNASGSSGFVSGYGSGNGPVITQTLQNTGIITETVNYFISLSAYGCAGDPASYTVYVNPLPAVTNTVCFDSVTMTGAQPFPLHGGTPAGGTWSGPGVSSGIFNPSLAGTGLKAVTYSFTNRFGCSRGVTRTIRVLAPAAFSCGGKLTDIRDGHAYSTVQIGTQCWMAENLDFGSQIPESIHQRDNCVAEKYVLTFLVSRPSFYQWDELMNYSDTPGTQGLCPPGWHVPSDAEWNTLFTNWSGSSFSGAPLIYSGYSGFDALLYGARHFNRQWDYSGFAAFFWTSSPHGPFKAWGHGMNSVPDDQSVCLYPSARTNAFSVRCLKD